LARNHSLKRVNYIRSTYWNQVSLLMWACLFQRVFS